MLKKILVVFALQFSSVCFSQTTFPVNGAPSNHHNVYIFKNVTLHVDYQTTIANASLIIQDGIILGAGEKLTEPAGAVVYDLKGKHIYPSFIDIYSEYGMPDAKAPQKSEIGRAHV